MSGIEWTNKTLNPTSGCDRVSPGCDNCYALGMAKRLKAMGSPGYQNDGDPLTSGPGFALTLHPERLDLVSKWRKPAKIFVNSMSDLFHKDVPDAFLAQVFDVMADNRRHTFQILTKRHARMRSWVTSYAATRGVLQNVHLGVSVESQQWADIRIPALLDTPAAIRWISAEPLLGPIDLDLPRCDVHDRREITTDGFGSEWCGACSADGFSGELSFGHWLDPLNGGLSWVVVGGESGPGARPMHPGWARKLRDQCSTASVPFLFKQWGSWGSRDDSPAVPAIGVWLYPDGSTTTNVLSSPSRAREVGEPAAMFPMSKKLSGRRLDGVTHDGYPAVSP